MPQVIDLSHRQGLMDRLEDVLDYLPTKQKAPYEELFLQDLAQESVSLDLLREKAFQAGAETWAARQAFRQFLTSMGQELEWEQVVKHVSKPVAFFLQLHRGKDEGLVDVLSHQDIGHALYPEQLEEISLVQQEVHRRLFQEHREMLESMMDECQSELEGIKTYLKRQKEYALGLTGAEQERLLDLIAEQEARLYLLGEWLPIEVLRDVLEG